MEKKPINAFASKQMLLAGVALFSAIAFTGCKSSAESSYKKAYEKAKAQEQAEQRTTEPVSVTPVTPVTTVQPVTPTDNSDLRSERLNVMNNGTLKAYNVVCGSFKSIDNANNLRNTLVNKGYNAQVAQNPETGMYRVVASSFDDRTSAINSRNDLRATYPDAWILLRTY
ncbi:MAG: SPOR domain-containing protein [Bacteroidaceae bacterium]|nr:SPOR domain-containing protein [Bacteroidaceae bacterium]